MKQFLIFLLLLSPMFLKAQQPSKRGVLHLTKDSLLKNGEVWLEDNWKFHAGDDSIMAAKEYDDADWKGNVAPYINMQKGDDKKIGFNGIGWFRYYFSTDTSLNRYPISLTIHQTGASAIYLDGKLLATYGSFSKQNRSQYVNPNNEPLSILIADSGMHVLAVCYENYDAEKRFRKYSQDEGGFMLSFNTAEDSFYGYVINYKSSAITCLTIGCTFFTLFIVHLILFLFYKGYRSNLYFSLFNLGIGLFVLLIFLGFSTDSIAVKDSLAMWKFPLLSMACFSLCIFVNDLFGKSKVRFKIIAGLCVVVIILPFYNYKLALNGIAILTIICSMEAAITLSIAMYKKVRGAKIIGTGIVFFVIFFAIIIIVSAINQGIHMDADIILIPVMALGILAIFSIPFSMSAYLAWSFATVNRDLGKQLMQVEQLSLEALQHEQEKQQLLENRQEELEREVELRTTEVIHQKEQIEEQHEALKSEKKKSDELLLNILPAEIAEELKENGKSKAQLFDDVSVLFTDFVNFTQISERLGAEELVAELHECFQAFDNIMERNGMEKIKTIGDAYLAVSGMPVHNDLHAYNAVKAGIEIIAFMKARNVHFRTFEIRIGIHSGPLVAGIVGVKKFAYDIWGDTVNTASRMESTSEAGKINISAATHQLVKNDFTFTYRGKIDAKHKGEIDMYFVESDLI